MRLPDVHASEDGGQNHPLGDRDPGRPAGQWAEVGVTREGKPHD